jgi:hypothetical protein
MRRVSRMMSVAAAFLAAGCNAPQPAGSMSLPEPNVQARRSARPPVRQTPPPSPPPVYDATVKAVVKPAPTPPPDDLTLNTATLVPPGGIRKKWSVIVVHHSANANDSPRSMDSFHRHTRGWDNGLGYHFVIGNGVNYPNGKVFAGSRWKDQETGAHCKSDAGRFFGVFRPDNFFNEKGIGVCLVGNFEGGAPSARQLDALEDLITFLCAQTGIPPSRVYGHGEITHKTACPGRVLKSRLAQVRKDVARNLALADNFDGEPDYAFLTETGCETMECACEASQDAQLGCLWLDFQLAAIAHAQRDRAVLAAHAVAEDADVGRADLVNPLDHVADLQTRLRRGAVLRDIDDHHALGVGRHLHALP